MYVLLILHVNDSTQNTTKEIVGRMNIDITSLRMQVYSFIHVVMVTSLPLLLLPIELQMCL